MSKFKNFVPLHCHQQSLDSASTPEAFTKKELELGTGALCCTDHGSMAACCKVYDLAKKNNLVPILGVEGYVKDPNDPILAACDVPKGEDGTYSNYNSYCHITLAAKNQKAYETLCRLLSKADLRGEVHGGERKPLFDWSDLEEMGAYDITAGSGCLVGMIQGHLVRDMPRPDVAEAYYKALRGIFKDNFFVEVFPHRCDRDYVSGVFIKLENGITIDYYKGKKFKTTLFEEITGTDLALVWSKNKNVGKLVGIKNYSVWDEIEPLEIIDVKAVNDFIKNECTVYAPDGDKQLGGNKFVLELAQKFNDIIYISDDSHYSKSEEHLIQDIRLGGVNGTWKFYETYKRYSSEEAFEYFHNVLGISEKTFEKWIDDSYGFRDQFKDFKFEDKISLPTKFYPSDTLEHLKTLIDRHGRMDWNNPKMVERLSSEIELIYNNGKIDLLPYFFMAEDIRTYYREKKHLGGPGRGSAAGLLLSYLLNITDIEPLRFDLSKDRFLTIDRILSGKMPDVDMDFGSRELIIDPKEGFLYKRFGDHVAAISTNTMLRLKSSIKDVERALDGSVSYDTELMCKDIPNTPQGVEDFKWLYGYTSDDGKEVPGFWDSEEASELREYASKNPKRWECIKSLIGLTRSKSVHASALVIANEPISNFLPLVTINEVRATQYDDDGVEARGGLKIDILGLNSLLDIQGAIQLIQNKNPESFVEDKSINGKLVPAFRMIPTPEGLRDIWDLPEDKAVFEDICSGNTETVFQFNTNSALQWLKVFNHCKHNTNDKIISSLNDMSVFTALDRPGPLDAMVEDKKIGKKHNMLVEYVNRARGLPSIDPVEFLNKTLPETYGILCFQEQIEKVYRILMDCDGVKASIFRTNLAKKKMDKVEAAYPEFIEKASLKISREQAEKVWGQIKTFGSYGFCCFDKDQKISTKDGFKPISEIECEDLVEYTDANGNLYFEHPMPIDMGEKEVFEVKLEDGTTIRCTEDHLFLVNNKWLSLKELKQIGYIECIKEKNLNVNVEKN